MQVAEHATCNCLRTDEKSTPFPATKYRAIALSQLPKTCMIEKKMIKMEQKFLLLFPFAAKKDTSFD